MPQPEPNSAAVDNRKQRRRGKTKGRIVDLNALLEVQALLGDESRAQDLLIEHLHKIQDSQGHLSAAHLVALAHEMRLSTTEVYEVALLTAPPYPSPWWRKAGRWLRPAPSPPPGAQNVTPCRLARYNRIWLPQAWRVPRPPQP